MNNEGRKYTFFNKLGISYEESIKDFIGSDLDVVIVEDLNLKKKDEWEKLVGLIKLKPITARKLWLVVKKLKDYSKSNPFMGGGVPINDTNMKSTTEESYSSSNKKRKLCGDLKPITSHFPILKKYQRRIQRTL